MAVATSCVERRILGKDLPQELRRASANIHYHFSKCFNSFHQIVFMSLFVVVVRVQMVICVVGTRICLGRMLTSRVDTLHRLGTCSCLKLLLQFICLYFYYFCRSFLFTLVNTSDVPAMKFNIVQPQYAIGYDPG